MKTLPAQNRRQLGGTLTGFVVGLLAGLGIALSVAIYVTRVPVPFVDRGVSRNPAQDAAETARNQGWNPNASLSSQQAPLPSAPPVLPEAATAGPATVPAAPGQPAPAAPETATASDPLGDLVRSRTGGSASAAPAAPAATAAAAPGAPDTKPPEAESSTFFVQAGAFRAPEEAEAQRAKLAMLGVAADITERDQGGRPVYRVRVGPFSQKTVADATLQQLGSQGIEAALVRVQR